MSITHPPRSIAPPGASHLRPGWWLSWHGDMARIVAVDWEGMSVLVESLVTAARTSIGIRRLLVAGDADDAPVFGPTLDAVRAELDRVRHTQPPAPVATPDLPPVLTSRATTIVRAVETVRALVARAEARARADGKPFGRTDATLEAIADLHTLNDPIDIQKSQYYAYRRLYDACAGDTGRIAASLRRSSHNRTRMSPAQLHFIDTHILRFYAREPLWLNPLELYHTARSTLTRTGNRWPDPALCGGQVPRDVVDDLLDDTVPMATIEANAETRHILTMVALPSRAWLYAYLKWFRAQPDEGKRTVIARHGDAFYEREHLVFDTFAAHASLPLEYIFSDHHLIDLFSVDEETRRQVDRLWVSVLLDAYSRSVIGFTLRHDPPGIAAIQGALRHAIWPKEPPASVGTALPGPWVCYGIPQMLFLDNAWAHHSHSLEHLARAIGAGGRYPTIDLVFRPPYKARYGALIERFFGTLTGKLRHLPGGIWSRDPAHLRGAAEKACLLYADVYAAIYHEILAYQHTPHSELGGQTPHEVWTTALEHCGFPQVPAYTPAVDRIFWTLSPSTRTIGAHGVHAFGLTYWSPALSAIDRVDRQGCAVAYSIAYDADNLARIALFHDGAHVCDLAAKELRLPDGTHLRVSQWERALAGRFAAKDGQAGRDWLAYVNGVRTLTAARQREKASAARTARAQPAGPPRAVDDTAAIERALAALSAEDIDRQRAERLARFAGGAPTPGPPRREPEGADA